MSSTVFLQTAYGGWGSVLSRERDVVGRTVGKERRRPRLGGRRRGSTTLSKVGAVDECYPGNFVDLTRQSPFGCKGRCRGQ